MLTGNGVGILQRRFALLTFPSTAFSGTLAALKSFLVAPCSNSYSETAVMVIAASPPKLFGNRSPHPFPEPEYFAPPIRGLPCFPNTQRREAASASRQSSRARRSRWRAGGRDAKRKSSASVRKNVAIRKDGDSAFPIDAYCEEERASHVSAESLSVEIPPPFRDASTLFLSPPLPRQSVLGNRITEPGFSLPAT